MIRLVPTNPLAEEARYADAAAEVRAFAAALPPPLPAHCAPFLDGLLAGGFARLAALLPGVLADLLPVPPRVAARLGLAQLFGWWHAAARDALVDGEARPEVALGGGLALLRAVALYAELGVDGLPCRPLLDTLEARSAAAYARELASRPVDGIVGAANIAPWRGSLIADRAAGLMFAAFVQMDLAGLPPADPRRAGVETALGCLVAARQMTDDAGDWPEDLRAGRLSGASAALAAGLLDAGAAGLTLERLAAQLALDEPFWAWWWASHEAVCAEGRAALAPFGPTRLDALLDAELKRGAATATAGAVWRVETRALLGFGDGDR